MKAKRSIENTVMEYKRYCLQWNFIIGFMIVGFLLRVGLYIWQYDEVSWHFIHILRTVATGLFFDFGTSLFITWPGVLYFTVLPGKFIGTKVDKLLTYIFFTLTILLLVLTFFAEITFWAEFRTRFNFIAVDYLIYTYELLRNVNESYPLPILISGVLLITAAISFTISRRGIFADTFSHKPAIYQRLKVLSAVSIIILFFSLYVNNGLAEWSANRYNNEISKSGIYSFFAALRTNQISYSNFYTSISNERSFGILKSQLQTNNITFSDKELLSIEREVNSAGLSSKPNVVFILMESMSANFMEEFGNKNKITPSMDSMAKNSIIFKDLYATGTRTVRGMEAVTLCIPPTPGQSIVKRPDNQNLYTVATIFSANGYAHNFFYGGDGYFDNMNSYFGGNGFTIYDRGRGSLLSDKIKTTRHNISDNEVTFENAWGVCDEDIYNKMLKVADGHYKQGKPFFNFIMTTSNHRPYSYPSGKIDIPSGTCRNGAVKYADYAVGKMINEARTRPWFKNTVFVLVADHCASSAGKDEIDIANYHIPALIYNLPGQKFAIEKQCSQIDVFPTLFALFHWKYKSNFFGQDVLSRDYKDRALIGTYLKLGLLRRDKVMVLSEQKKQSFYNWNQKDNSLSPLSMDQNFLEEAVSYYQTADYMFNNKLLRASR